MTAYEYGWESAFADPNGDDGRTDAERETRWSTITRSLVDRMAYRAGWYEASKRAAKMPEKERGRK